MPHHPEPPCEFDIPPQPGPEALHRTGSLSLTPKVPKRTEEGNRQTQTQTPLSGMVVSKQVRHILPIVTTRAGLRTQTHVSVLTLSYLMLTATSNMS